MGDSMPMPGADENYESHASGIMSLTSFHPGGGSGSRSSFTALRATRGLIPSGHAT